MTAPTAPAPGPASPAPEGPGADGAAGRSRAGLVVTVVAALAVLAAGTAWAVTAREPGAAGSSAQAAEAVARPVVALASGGPLGAVPYDAPLVLAATDGTLTAVDATDAGGTALEGRLGPQGWTSTGQLFPATAYRLEATVRDAAGATSTRTLLTSTAPATGATLTAALSPGDDRVVGIGQPVAVRLDAPVTDPAARAAVVARLSVTTTPAVAGAWRWMDDSELHYRAADFWAPGTEISVTADFTRLALPGGTFGEGVRSTRFTVGEALTAVVDVAAHTMTVSRGGEVLRTMRASMGRPGYDTRGGTFLVLEKFEDKVMDGSTLAVPADYSTAVKHAVRISNSGTFTHGAPWSVASQGVRNVSHGCINLSPADAEWYFDQAKRGDVVTVVNAVEGPLSYDAGSRDWNMTWEEWQQPS